MKSRNDRNQLREKCEVRYLDKKELAKRLNTTVDEFHRIIKEDMQKGKSEYLKKIGNCGNPDIGIGRNGKLFLRHRITKKEIDTGVSFEQYIVN